MREFLPKNLPWRAFWAILKTLRFGIKARGYEPGNWKLRPEYYHWLAMERHLENVKNQCLTEEDDLAHALTRLAFIYHLRREKNARQD